MVLTVCVTTHCQFIPLFHPDLNHRRFRIDKIPNRLDNLEHILAVDLLPVLEPLDHIIDKPLCHFVPNPDTVISIVHRHRIDIQVFESRWRVANLNRLLEFHTTDEFLAVC